MTQIYANNFTTLVLGRRGENLARKVVFDIRDLESLYGTGDVEVIYQRPGDAQPYPLAVQRDGTLVTWDVTATDTEMSDGSGKCELRYYAGETLAKSKIWRTWVEPAMDTPSETTPPEPEKGWVDQIISVGAAAKASADAVKADADRAAALAAEVAEKAAQTAQDASDAAKAMDAAQTAQRLAEEAHGAAEEAQAAAEQSADSAAQSAHQAADSAAAASTSETNAKASETAAADSAKAAAASATAAEKAGRCVFVATYGETTSVEMEAAYQAGKLLVMRSGNLTAHLYRRYSDHQFAFNTVERIFQCFMDRWSSQTFKSTPSSHAGTHASGGDDPITPESIGAAPASHAEDTAIHLPTVTADDNGKFLCVVNGAWAAVSYPSAEGSTF